MATTLKNMLRRLARRITWWLETTEWPQLCAKTDCLTVLAKPVTYAGGATWCERHATTDKERELADLVKRTAASGGNIMEAMRARPDLTGLEDR